LAICCSYSSKVRSPISRRLVATLAGASSGWGTYAGAQKGGPLGDDEVVLIDQNGDRHAFRFETFFNGHEALTLGIWLRAIPSAVSVTR